MFVDKEVINMYLHPISATCIIILNSGVGQLITCTLIVVKRARIETRPAHPFH